MMLHLQERQLFKNSNYDNFTSPIRKTKHDKYNNKFVR